MRLIPGIRRLVPILLGAIALLAGMRAWAGEAGLGAFPLHPAPGGTPGFKRLDPAFTGVLFTNLLEGDAYATNAVAHNGSGLAIGDVDGDGWQDIYFCSLQGPNRLYRNLGNWKFKEVELGDAVCRGQVSTGAAFADVDGDGDLDLLVNGVAAGTRLFLNDGKGGFIESKDSGLSRTASATSLALADIDGDGDLDLYCTHYIDVMHLVDPTTRFSIIKRDGRWVVLKVNDQPTTMPHLKDRFEALPDGRVRELPEVHGLYRNDGKGHFTPIQSEPGVFMNASGQPILPYRDWGLAVMFRDLNGDGYPDIYVCNDNVSPDRIWINTGRGTFREMDAPKLRHTSRSSMGVDFADVDRDGRDDFIVVDMLGRDHAKRMSQLVRDVPDLLERERAEGRPQYNRNMLFMGRGDGSFAETALQAGVAATDWSWCPIFLDVDLDGYEDLLVTNGFDFDVMDQDSSNDMSNPAKRLTREQRKRSLLLRPRWRTENAAFRNRGDGTFEPTSRLWGFDQKGVSYGMALADLDNDGDLDVVVNNFNEVATLYRNNSSSPRIAVRLQGLPPNTQGIGARLRLGGGALAQSQEMIAGGRYMSGDQALRVFAAAPGPQAPKWLEVKWRDGSLTTVSNLEPNFLYEVRQAGALASTSNPASGTPSVSTLFNDVTTTLGHVHEDAAYDDWARQPLLPRRLSQLGPGVAWQDVNGDGWEDLVVAAGSGGRLAVLTNNAGHGFRLLEGPAPMPFDQGPVVAWPDGRGGRKLLVGISSYEMAPEQESFVARYSLTNLGTPAKLMAGKAALGPMAVADVDGDGDLDLFVGGRFRPGHYPEPVSSSLWLNEGGELKPSPSGGKPFEGIGLVSGAAFADLDGDGQPDLVLAMEWGPVRVFHNDHGRFEDVSTAWGTATLTGWWNGVTAGDFDGDGRLDLAVGNWGRNSVYELEQSPAFRIYYDETGAEDGFGLIEAFQRGSDWFPIRNRSTLAPSLPGLEAQFPTHRDFGQATVRDLLGPRLAKARLVEAMEFRSGVFMNRGSRFEFIPFPREAQRAPAFSVNVGDADGDGVEDVFLSQNFLGGSSDLSRDDGGLGLWLLGKGDGTFAAMDPADSGVSVSGEQRGAALADFNHDGRVDLVVSQNNGPTKLYLNQRARPGVRVVLHGPQSNPDGVGALIRIVYGANRFGPARLVQAGSGYWSQDAAAQVMGCAGNPVGVSIRWPGGREQVLPVASVGSELTVDYLK